MTTLHEPKRKRLPITRPSITRKGEICGHEVYVTVGFYDDAEDAALPGEVFVKVAKHGSMLAGLVDGWCVMTSLSLQYGVPWEKIDQKFRHTMFGNETQDPEHSSLLDGICKLVTAIVEERRKIIDAPELLAAL